MYPKVVPVAAAAPARSASVHNFSSENLRTSLEISGRGPEPPKRSTSL
jgi:hypothetical protein